MNPTIAITVSLIVASLASAASSQSAPGPSMAPETPAPASSSVIPTPAPGVASQPQGHVPAPPAGKSEVVFFRTGAYAGAGIWYKIREDGAELGKLTNQSYFVAVLNPGPHTFTASTENKTSLKLELDEDEIYYVRGTVHMGIIMGEPNLSPADQALFDLHFAHMKETEAVSDETAGKPAG